MPEIITLDTLETLFKKSGPCACCKGGGQVETDEWVGYRLAGEECVKGTHRAMQDQHPYRFTETGEPKKPTGPRYVRCATCNGSGRSFEMPNLNDVRVAMLKLIRETVKQRSEIAKLRTDLEWLQAHTNDSPNP